jgi:hypothetical protein
VHRKTKAPLKRLKPHADISELVEKRTKEQDEIDEQDIQLSIEEWERSRKDETHG